MQQIYSNYPQRLSFETVTAQMLCELRHLHHLTIYAARANDGHPGGLTNIPAAVSRLQSLRSLELYGHEALLSLPEELFRLTR
jgi:hypothetical protein